MTKENLQELLQQREELSKKIAAQAEEEVQNLKSRLETISKITGKSIYKLLDLKEPAKTGSGNNTNTNSDPDWKKFKKDNDGKKFILPDGKEITLNNKGPNKQGAESAWREGTLKEV